MQRGEQDFFRKCNRPLNLVIVYFGTKQTMKLPYCITPEIWP